MQYYNLIMLQFNSLIIVFCLLFASCNYFDFSTHKKDAIVKNRIQEMKANGLEYFPQIEPCSGFKDEKCFKKQLVSKLKNKLQETIIANDIQKNDTIWLSIKVDRKGITTLTSFSDTNLNIKKTIETTFESLSPIEPAIINGIKVSTQFKIPLLLK